MKRKLLFAIVALMCSVGTWAQGWTASAPATGDFYLYNVGANAYLENGSSWGTHAALKSSGFVLNVTAGSGVYTLGTNSKYAGKYFTDNGYVDTGSSTNWTFEPVAGLTDTYKLRTAAGDYAYAAAGMYNVEIGADPGTNKAYWKLVTAANRNSDANATNLTPVEWTHKIANPRFDDNVDNWSGDAPARGGNTGGSNGNVGSYDDRNPCAEHYNKTYDTYQELSGLANGTYAVSVQGFYREGGYADAAAKHVAGTESLNAIFYANAEEQPLMSIFEEAGKASSSGTATTSGIEGAFPDKMSGASYFFSAGLYWNTVYVTVTDGTLKIGIKKSTSVGADWTIFDNFRLQYFGNCTIAEAKNGALIVAYNNALATAQTLAGNAMEASAKTTLNSVIDANDDIDTSSATAEALTAATTNLNNAIAAAQPSADLYVSIKTLLDGLKTQDASFDGDTKYNAGTYTAISEVYTDYYAYAIAQAGTAVNADFTNVIVNPGFEFGNTTGWTYKASNDHGAKSTSNPTYQMSDSEGSYLFNIWSAGYPITQTITGLPNGIYELTAVVANSSDGDPAKVYLIANDTHEGITCDTNGAVGVEGTVKCAVTDGTLTIGAVGSNNDAERSYIAAGVWWYKVDNFRLKYLGDLVSDEDAAALLATVPSGVMKSSVSTALDDAVTAFEASKTTDNYAALVTAIDNANTSIAAYAKAKAAVDKANDIKDNNNFVTDAAATTFAAAIAAISDAYDARTLEDDAANNAGITLGTAVSGWHANASGAAGVYMQSAWANIGFDKGYYINTWSTEGDNDGSNFSVPFFEYYTDNNQNLAANTFTATLSGLDNGAYEVELWARVQRRSDADFNSNNSMITMSVNDGEAVSIMSGQTTVGSGTSVMRLGRYKAYGQVTDGTLTLSIDVKLGANVHWLSWRDIKYTKLSDVTISEEDTSAPTPADFANVTLTRTLKGGQWNGFSVPFGFTVAGSALDGAEVKQFKSVSDNEIMLEDATVIVAGDPYLVKPANENIVNPTFYGVMVSNPAEAVKGDGDYKFAAHLYNTALPTDGSVAYVSTTDSSIKKLTSGGIKGLRSIFNIPTGSNVKALTIQFEDSTDGILTVDAEGNIVEGAIYNLAGQRISAPKKGVNIINGKKVLVK